MCDCALKCVVWLFALFLSKKNCAGVGAGAAQ